MSEIAVRIGRNIREARKGAGLSMRELAALAGVSVPALGTWENAQREIGAGNLLAVARALGVPVAALLGEAELDASSAYRAGYRAGWSACAARVRSAAEFDGEPVDATEPVGVAA